MLAFITYSLLQYQLQDMLSEAELVRRNRLEHEGLCTEVPLKVTLPHLVQRFPATGAVSACYGSCILMQLSLNCCLRVHGSALVQQCSEQ
jgi:hypothetical protein